MGISRQNIGRNFVTCEQCLRHYVFTGWKAVQELRRGVRSVFLCRLQIVRRCGPEAVSLRTVRHLQVTVVFMYNNVMVYLHCRTRPRIPTRDLKPEGYIVLYRNCSYCMDSDMDSNLDPDP